MCPATTVEKRGRGLPRLTSESRLSKQLALLGKIGGAHILHKIDCAIFDMKNALKRATNFEWEEGER